MKITKSKINLPSHFIYFIKTLSEDQKILVITLKYMMLII